MSLNYWGAFLLSFAISLTLTPVIRQLALGANKLDLPNWRKIHTRPVPRLGGVGIVLGFLVPFFLLTSINRQFLGLLSGLLIVFLVGLIDDLRGLGAWTKFYWQIVAAIAVLAGGIGIVDFTNPLGGLITLDGWRIPVEIGPLAFNILPIANFVTILWIVGMMNVVNFLDGLDGLAGGVGSITALVIFILALSPVSGNPVVALLAVILVGSLLGFLPYNFNPSTIFMGDSGAYALGLLLALLSIYSESKIAVGSLVLGFAILDAVIVALRRIWRGKSPFQPDRNHLHHQLLDLGVFSHRQVVVIIYLLTILVAIVLLIAGGIAAFAVLLLSVMGLASLIRLFGPEHQRRL